MAERIWIDRGRLIRIRPWSPLSLRCTEPCDAAGILEYQTFDEHGAPNTGSYRGPGTLTTDAAGHSVVILGDPMHHATLTDLTVADEPTTESRASYDAMRAGFEAATREIKPGRRLAAKGHDWLEGYDAGARCCPRR